jgi:phospholipid/cholesterol/gamma-HCH transport system substrate-binding protein
MVRAPTRLVAPGALLVAVVAVVILLTGSASPYVLHARFYNAGQLVGGDQVTVGGHQVGSVGAITLTRHGLADIELDINDSTVTPLRQGTIATIGQTSLTGVANRIVALTPGTGSSIPSGSILPPTQTRGIVDLDTLLDTLTPRVRASLQHLLHAGAYLVAQPTAGQLNSAIGYSEPAFGQSAALGDELAVNRTSVSEVVSATARVSSALAAHDQQLGGAVHNLATTFQEIATERSALADAISRAPGVLTQSTHVLGHVGATARVLDPVLIHLRPVSVRLGQLLTGVLPAAAHAIPTLNGLRALVPGAEAALEGFPAVEKRAVPAIASLTRALHSILPSLADLRPYTPDVVAGFFNGVGGATTGAYDANGHYLHGEVTIQAGGSSLTGLLNLLSKLTGKLTGKAGPLDGERLRLLAPCPGGGGPPAPDGSNPWTSPDLLPGSPPICKPADDQR